MVVANFTPVPLTGYRVGVPHPGFYPELINSDATHYGGSNLGNSGGLTAEATAWQGQPYSLLITIPPLGVVYFKAPPPPPKVAPAAEPPPAIVDTEL